MYLFSILCALIWNKMKGGYKFYNTLLILNFKSSVMTFISASIRYRKSIIICTLVRPTARYE